MINLSSRQFHLKEMGIPQWYARYSLLGAKRSSICLTHSINGELASGAQADVETDVKMSDQISAPVVLPEESTSQNESRLDRHETDLSDSTDLHEIKILPEIPSIESSFVGSPDYPKPVATFDRLNSQDLFSLRLYRSGECMIISESENGSSSLPELKLLQNILSAIDWLPYSADSSHYVQEFNWPVFDSLGLFQSQEGICEQLLTRWFDQYLEQACGAFLYFGSYHKAPFELCKHLIQSKDSSSLFLCKVEHSLADLLNLPSRKDDVWQQLSGYSVSG